VIFGFTKPYAYIILLFLLVPSIHTDVASPDTYLFTPTSPVLISIHTDVASPDVASIRTGDVGVNRCPMIFFVGDLNLTYIFSRHWKLSSIDVQMTRLIKHCNENRRVRATCLRIKGYAWFAQRAESRINYFYILLQ